MKDRTNQILSLLTENPKLEVTALSHALGVSQVTVRKDLDGLERRGIVHREHGYALLASPDDIGGRMAYHYEDKRRIAVKASELVRDGETVMIESGSCCALLADALTASHRNLTIITNSAFIADFIRNKSAFEVVLLGGVYQQSSQVMVGPMVRQCVENFWVERFFIGVDGWSAQTGFTNQDQMRAQAVRDMSLQCEKAVVLTESEKFGKRGTVPMNLKDRVKIVVTDSRIADEPAALLQNSGVEVIRAV